MQRSVGAIPHREELRPRFAPVRARFAGNGPPRRVLRALQAVPIQRLVVCHGEVIDVDPLGQLAEAWRLVGVE